MPAELITAATVGALHRSVALTDLPIEVQPAPLPADPALALLDAAALLTCATRTTLPTVAPSRPLPPPAETLPVISDQARQVLSRMHEHRELLIEALTTIQVAGQRLPADLVPTLLDDERPAVVAAARPVGGEIGRWLMAKNPRWTAVDLDPAVETAWAEGTKAERSAWLQGLRQRDPAAARAVLERDLKSETADSRAAFLACLADQLGGADEPLLLSCLTDNSRKVAGVALELLTALTGSTLRNDMAELFRRHIELKRGLLRTTLTLTEPAAAEFGPWPGGSPRLAVVVSRVDPADWPSLLDADLMVLVRKRDERLEPLLPALREAAVTFRHRELAEALVQRYLFDLDVKKPAPLDAELWGTLDPIVAGRIFEDLWERVDASLLGRILEAMPTPWSAEFAVRLPHVLTTPVTGPGRPVRSWWNLWASSIALADCGPAARSARSVNLAADDSTLTRHIGAAVSLVTLRSVLVEALHPSGEIR